VQQRAALKKVKSLLLSLLLLLLSLLLLVRRVKIDALKVVSPYFLEFVLRTLLRITDALLNQSVIVVVVSYT